MERITPAQFGGYGRQQGVSSDDESQRGLLNLTLNSRCPPDIQPNTRILAICGITDFTGNVPETKPPSDSDSDTPGASKSKAIKGTMSKLVGKSKDLLSSSKRKERKKGGKSKEQLPHNGQASPHNDGWFFSDFYLFHHLFEGLG